METTNGDSTDIKTNPNKIIAAGSDIKLSVTFSILTALCGPIIIIIFLSSVLKTITNGGRVNGGDFIGIYIFIFIAFILWIISLVYLYNAGSKLKKFVEFSLQVALPKVKTLQISDDTGYIKSDYTIKEVKKTKSFIDGEVDAFTIEFSNGKCEKVYYSYFEKRYYFLLPNSKDSVKYLTQESAILGLDYFLQTSRIAEES
jgi:hypothetical protein